MNICFNADIFGLINSRICKYQMIAIRTTTMAPAIPAEILATNFRLTNESSVYKTTF